MRIKHEAAFKQNHAPEPLHRMWSSEGLSMERLSCVAIPIIPFLRTWPLPEPRFVNPQGAKTRTGQAE